MKSIILKTLAATSLVAAAQADVHVLGAVWKERGINAPEGEILVNPGTVAATRGYLIFYQNILTETPSTGALILYRDIRSGGSVPNRVYTIDTSFSAFTADIIEGGSGGRRIYGHVPAPVTIADVSDVVMPFSGTTLGSQLPNHLNFDTTVFQTGSVTGLTGPRIIRSMDGGSVLRSSIGGSAGPINVAATTVGTLTTGAIKELTDRLIAAGYHQGEVAPVITTDLAATADLVDGEQKILSVTLDPDTFGTLTYRWFRDNVQVATTPTFTVTGGQAATGAGTYRVEVTNAAGTDVSSNIVVSFVASTISADLPTTLAIAGASTSVLSVTLSPAPEATPTYQWFKGGVAIAAADGGNGATLSVTGGAAATGAGTYRVEITNSVPTTLVSGNCVVTVSNVAVDFSTNLPPSLVVPFAGSSVLAPVVLANVLPPVATYQWAKATLAVPGTFTNIAAGNGGNAPTYTVTGNLADINGPGVYRLTITSAAPAPITTDFTTCTVTAGP